MTACPRPIRFVASKLHLSEVKTDWKWGRWSGKQGGHEADVGYFTSKGLFRIDRNLIDHYQDKSTLESRCHFIVAWRQMRTHC